MTTTTRPDYLVDEWLEELRSSDCEEYIDLDTALSQHAIIWDPRRHTADPRVKPLALLESVTRLRHWQATSAAPKAVKDAMGVIADDIRRRAGSLYDSNLIDEVERLRRDLYGAENAVLAMRQRAAYLVEYSSGTPAEAAEAIRALPLLPDGDDTEVRHIADA